MFRYFRESREDSESPWVLEGSWEAYVDGALPGILMLGDPQTADAYRQDPEFFSFLRSHEAYRRVLDENTTLLLNSERPFFKQLK